MNKLHLLRTLTAVVVMTLAVAVGVNGQSAVPPLPRAETPGPAVYLPLVAKPLPESIDDLFAKVATQVPGFGGMFIGTDGQLWAYLLDTSQRAAAQQAIREVFAQAQLPAGELQVLQGQYGFLQLKTWHDRQRLTTLALPGVILASIDEETNRLHIGVANPANIGLVRKNSPV